MWPHNSYILEYYPPPLVPSTKLLISRPVIKMSGSLKLSQNVLIVPGFFLKLLIAIHIDFTVNIDKVLHPSSKVSFFILFIWGVKWFQGFRFLPPICFSFSRYRRYFFPHMDSLPFDGIILIAFKIFLSSGIYKIYRKVREYH